MEEMKIGQFVRDRRMELGLTQQQLADRLGITDKAVSKWERAVSYPDITILRDLAAALEVSVTELLAGERDQQLPDTVPPEVQEVVLDTVGYAETARKRNGGWRFWLFVALSAGCAIAALVVCIVNGFRFTWSKRVLQCLAFGWAVCYPLLRSERYPVRNAMVIASVFVYPLLWSLGARRAWHLGIVVVSIAYAWAMYGIFRYYWQQKGLAIGLILLLGGLLQISVNILVGRSLEAAALVVGGVLFLDIVCLAGAYVFVLRRRGQNT